ncbi:unnamed protein product, partial [Allacma fusca]
KVLFQLLSALKHQE